jgi:predicted nucleic acid-binding protein
MAAWSYCRQTRMKAAAETGNSRNEQIVLGPARAPLLFCRQWPIDVYLVAYQFAVTTVSIASVLTGPLQSGNEALAEHFRTILGSWQVVDLTADIAATAARLRASLRLKLADAVQAIAVNADALITYDRDFSRVRSLRVLP